MSGWDARANSLARLGEGAEADAKPCVWWWSLLSTQMDGSLPSGAPLQLAELWPKPAEGTTLLVFKPQATSPVGGNFPGPGKPCVNGSVASSCLTLWDATTPLPIETRGAPAASNSDVAPKQNFTLFAAAPVLSNGWTLLGDLRKLVPCSPQRFVAPSDTDAPHDDDLTAVGGSTNDADGAELAFTVLGSMGEVVEVTVVAPPAASGSAALEGTVIVVDVTIGDSGEAKVVCAKGACSSPPPP